MMSPTEISCELVDEVDLDTRYLAGALSEEEAEAFEAHFFRCERCWGLVQQGLAVQAVYAGAGPQAISTAEPPVLAYHTPSRLALVPRRWWGLAAAAAIVVAVAGIRWLGPERAVRQQGDGLRGRAATFLVVPDAKAGFLTAAWPRVPAADLYRVRLYAPDGTLALERDTQDTALSVQLDSLGALQREAEVFWQVQAFDASRNRIARSDLTRAVP